MPSAPAKRETERREKEPRVVIRHPLMTLPIRPTGRKVLKSRSVEPRFCANGVAASLSPHKNRTRSEQRSCLAALISIAGRTGAEP